MEINSLPAAPPPTGLHHFGGAAPARPRPQQQQKRKKKKKKEKMRHFLCPQALVPGTRSPVLLLCLPSTGVPVPLRLPKSTCQKEKKKVEKCAISSVLRCRSQSPALRFRRKKHGIVFVLRRWSQAPAHQSRRPASLAPGSLSLLGFQKALAKKRKKKGKNAQFPLSSSAGLRHPPPGPAGRNTGYSLSSGAGPRHLLTGPATLPP